MGSYFEESHPIESIEPEEQYSKGTHDGHITLFHQWDIISIDQADKSVK